MFRRKTSAPPQVILRRSKPQTSSNLSSFFLGVGCICLLGGMYLYQPTPEVTRAQNNLLSTPLLEEIVPVVTAQPEPTEAPVETAKSPLPMISQHLRLQDPQRSPDQYKDLAAAALAQLGYAGQGEALQDLLARALNEGQSNHYISGVLSRAAEQGQFALTSAITTPQGRLDTDRIMRALIEPGA